MDQNYDEMTMEELRALASELEVEGRSSMNKEELIAALQSQAEAVTEPLDEAQLEAEAQDDSWKTQTGATGPGQTQHTAGQYEVPEGELPIDPNYAAPTDAGAAIPQDPGGARAAESKPTEGQIAQSEETEESDA